MRSRVVNLNAASLLANHSKWKYIFNIDINKGNLRLSIPHITGWQGKPIVKSPFSVFRLNFGDIT